MALADGTGVALGDGAGVALGDGAGVALGDGAGVALGDGAGVALNATLRQTARFHLAFGALLALALTGWLP